MRKSHVSNSQELKRICSVGIYDISIKEQPNIANSLFRNGVSLEEDEHSMILHNYRATTAGENSVEFNRMFEEAKS